MWDNIVQMGVLSLEEYTSDKSNVVGLEKLSASTGQTLFEKPGVNYRGSPVVRAGALLSGEQMKVQIPDMAIFEFPAGSEIQANIASELNSLSPSQDWFYIGVGLAKEVVARVWTIIFDNKPFTPSEHCQVLPPVTGFTTVMGVLDHSTKYEEGGHSHSISVSDEKIVTGGHLMSAQSAGNFYLFAYPVAEKLSA